MPKWWVDFDPILFGSGLGMGPNETSPRIIIGVRGSGKTVYVRRMQAAAAKNSGVYADEVRKDTPSTENIIWFCQQFYKRGLIESWAQLWRCCILRSVVSHLLAAPNLCTWYAKKELRRFVPELYHDFRTPMDCFSQMLEITNDYHTKQDLLGYLNWAKWRELEKVISDVLATAPPIYMFLDELDADYDEAPMHWLTCHHGLFRCVMSLLGDPKFGSTLHVVIGIREQVMASVMQREGAIKYTGDTNIRTLNWSARACRFFLEHKVERLEREYLMRPSAGDRMVRWLGYDTVRNVVREIDEDVATYILRHTRMVPRDIVNVGNAISEAVARARAEGRTVLPGDELRAIIAKCSKNFASDQLTVCANQIASGSIPPTAAELGLSHYFTADSMHARDTREALVSVISLIGKDRFSFEELASVLPKAQELLGVGTDVFSALWQNRLMGYSENGGETPTDVYFVGDGVGQMNIPLRRKTYVFHSSLCDFLELQVVGKIPTLGI